MTAFTPCIAPRTLAIIDAAVEDRQLLIEGLVPGIEFALLDARRDGIEQITEILASRPATKTLHLVSHGSPGSLHLGNGALNLGNLDGYANALAGWNLENLLLYGCNVAAGDAGEEFLDKLHELTGANLAASATRIGNAALGGEWNLSARRGKPEVSLAFTPAARQDYAGVLYSIEQLSWNTGGGSSQFGQSFTTIAAGQITSITVYDVGNTSYPNQNLNVYQGEGIAGTNLGSTATGVMNLSAGQPFVFTFATPISVSASTKYTFSFSGNAELEADGSNPYADGTLYFGNTPVGALDLKFKVVIDPVPTATATATTPPPSPAEANLSLVGASSTLPITTTNPASFSETFGENAPIQTFNISNSGGSTLELGQITLPPGFVVRNSLPGNLDPGGAANLQLDLDGPPGYYSGIVQIKTNAGNGYVFIPVEGRVNLPSFEGAAAALGSFETKETQANQPNNIKGGIGSQVIAGGSLDDLIYGNQGADVLAGNDGNDQLFGGKGADVLFGGNGNDFLSGDLGNDTLLGGDGADIFQIGVGQAVDTLLDYSDGLDKIGLVSPLAFKDLGFVQDKYTTLIQFNGVTLANVVGTSIAQFDSTDFVSLA